MRSFPSCYEFYQSCGWQHCNIKPSYLSKWAKKLTNGDILSTRGVGQKELDAIERAAKEGRVLITVRFGFSKKTDLFGGDFNLDS